MRTWQMAGIGLLLASCGPGSEPIEDRAIGTVGGYTLAHPTGIFRVEAGGTFLWRNDIYVILSDEPDLCTAARAGLVSGLHLYFENGFEVTRREVRADDDASARALFRSPAGEAWTASSGTIEIVEYGQHDGVTGPNGERLCTGSYQLGFDTGDTLEGAWHASPCEEMKSAVEGCGCSSASTAPALLALASLAALGRRRSGVRNRQEGAAARPVRAPRA